MNKKINQKWFLIKQKQKNSQELVIQKSKVVPGSHPGGLPGWLPGRAIVSPAYQKKRSYFMCKLKKIRGLIKSIWCRFFQNKKILRQVEVMHTHKLRPRIHYHYSKPKCFVKAQIQNSIFQIPYFHKGRQLIFKEQRQWQVAADEIGIKC